MILPLNRIMSAPDANAALATAQTTNAASPSAASQDRMGQRDCAGIGAEAGGGGVTTAAPTMESFSFVISHLPSVRASSTSHVPGATTTVLSAFQCQAWT